MVAIGLELRNIRCVHAYCTALGSWERCGIDQQTMCLYTIDIHNKVLRKIINVDRRERGRSTAYFVVILIINS